MTTPDPRWIGRLPFLQAAECSLLRLRHVFHNGVAELGAFEFAHVLDAFSAHQSSEIVGHCMRVDSAFESLDDQFGDFVKAVVDVRQGIMAIGGELHADEEALLIEEGAQQPDLWGINLYPDRPAAERIEFDSMINVRPAQGNRSRSVDDPATRRQIEDVVRRLIAP